MNLYRYVENVATGATDPNGLESYFGHWYIDQSFANLGDRVFEFLFGGFGRSNPKQSPYGHKHQFEEGRVGGFYGGVADAAAFGFLPNETCPTSAANAGKIAGNVYGSAFVFLGATLPGTVAAGFTRTELAVVKEARAILSAKEFATLRAAFAAGKSVQVSIGGRTVVFAPSMRASGMTLFGENGFVIGSEAFASEAELVKTILHELFRLHTSQIGTRAAALQAQVAEETACAAKFAETAFNVFFK